MNAKTKHMSGREIADKLGTTDQNISTAIRNALGKLYTGIMKEKIAEHPFEAICTMMCVFKLDTASKEELNSFIKMLPEDVQAKVKRDALRRYSSYLI